MRFEKIVTTPIYNSEEWLAITGIFGVTCDNIICNSVIARSHTNSVGETERWAMSNGQPREEGGSLASVHELGRSRLRRRTSRIKYPKL